MAERLGRGEHDIHRAISVLNEGNCVAFPTETVYGIGGNAYDDKSVDNIYKIKGRPSKNPLIAHYSSIDAMDDDVVFSETALRLAKEFWPGPMTLVLRKKSCSRISKIALAGLDTVAVRIPAHDTALRLISAAGFPIAAPSANKSTHLSATNAQMVLDDFANDDLLVLDDGASTIGLESTIIDVTDEESVSILRYGYITPEDISPFCRLRIYESFDEAPKAPGMMFKHYSPRNHIVVINATTCDESDAYLDFGCKKDIKCAAYLNLSESGNLQEAAVNLYSMLYELDNQTCDRILVAPIPDIGIGIAINDKLRRASR